VIGCEERTLSDGLFCAGGTLNLDPSRLATRRLRFCPTRLCAAGAAPAAAAEADTSRRAARLQRGRERGERAAPAAVSCESSTHNLGGRSGGRWSMRR